MYCLYLRKDPAEKKLKIRANVRYSYDFSLHLQLKTLSSRPQRTITNFVFSILMSSRSTEKYTWSEIFFPLAINVFACISVVLVNKYVTKTWPFGFSLTCIHFITTFLILSILCFFGVFKYKKLNILQVLPLSLAFCFSIVLNNLSIQHNSVSFIYYPSFLI